MYSLVVVKDAGFIVRYPYAHLKQRYYQNNNPVHNNQGEKIAVIVIDRLKKNVTVNVVVAE